MIISLNWIRDYLIKNDIKIDPKSLAEKLTMRGFAVESIKTFSPTLDSVVAGKIISVEKHPDADKLSLVKVIISESEGTVPLNIVCGAQNLAPETLVAVALPGARLNNNIIIEKMAIRGVESEGMICSAKELGISEEAEDILHLPKHAKIGESVYRLLGAIDEDIIMDIELTPNRPDCLSMIGMAREIAPILGTKLRELKPAKFRISQHRTSSIIKVEIEDNSICSRYVGRIIDGLKVTESPDWIKQKLQAVGIKPINNIVDVTNFVMLETGQPLHAFDLRRITSGTIKVATCKVPQTFTTLTGEVINLENGDILIQDGEKPIALAGIMGGLDTEINEDTTSILLESAAFHAPTIRTTTKRLGLQTESSKRFEKGVDLLGVATASERASILLRDTFNGNVYHPPIDTNNEIESEKSIYVDNREIRRVIGISDFSPEKTISLLESIGITSHKRSKNIISVKVPSFRIDIKDSIDIVEEVARLFGYDEIPIVYPCSTASYTPIKNEEILFENRLRELLVEMGLTEVINYSFTSREKLKKFQNTSISLMNPISMEFSDLRTSLIPSILDSYSFNKNRGNFSLKLFELGKVYEYSDKSETGILENTRFCVLLSGKTINSNWKKNDFQVDFFYGKGIIEKILDELTTIHPTYEPLMDSEIFHPKKSAVLRLGFNNMGILGEVHPYYKSKVLETDEPIVIFEMDIDILQKNKKSGFSFRTLSKFPSIEFDIAFTVEKTVPYKDIFNTIKQYGGNLLSRISLFDIYENESIGIDKKSMAFHLVFTSMERTLLEKEAIELRDRIVENLHTRFAAELRK